MAVEATLRARPRRTAPAPQGSRFRTDIQAMRALAVLLVVLNHLWPLQVPGGYVGVDVFFVISGFLISSHLLREIEATGRVALRAFYARRARRLFPAAFLVLAATMLLTLWILPYPRWLSTAREVLASVFYAENWVLAAKSVDYSAMTESASAVQHYWSLSVEEQFYLLWPLTLMLFAFLARRRGIPVRRMLLTAVPAIAVLSLAYSIYITGDSPAEAYFVTPARIWEFAAGALVGLGARGWGSGQQESGAPSSRLRASGRRAPGIRLLRDAAALAGFALILGSAFLFDTETPFPGWLALIPVTGAALIILAGTGSARMGHDLVTGLRPVQFLGKISYSLYLWHWPLIVAAPYVFGVAPGVWQKLVILAVSLLLAWLTKRWIEDAWIKGRGRHTSRRTPGFRAPAAGMAAVAAAALLLGAAGTVQESRAVERASGGTPGSCHGPEAVANPGCGDPFAVPVALPHMGQENEYWPVPGQCIGEDDLMEGGGPMVCDFTGGNPEAETAWLVGDSHAQHWQEAVLTLAEERGWRVSLSYLGACPLLDAPLESFEGQESSPDFVEQCTRWSRTVAAAVEADRPDRVFMSTFASAQQIDDGSGESQGEQYVNALHRDWKRWTAAGSTVIPLVDPPLNGGVRDPACLSLNAAAPNECAVPRSQALGFDPFVEAAERMEGGKVKPVDLTRFFCDSERCYSAVGGVAVYYDPNHLNARYAGLLAPHLGALLD